MTASPEHRTKEQRSTVIVSHKHNFIFLKTQKTAGTSVEIALSRHCGPRDVITPIEEEVERRAAGGRGPQNDAFPVHRYTLKDLGRRVIKRKKRMARHHMPAPDVLQLVGHKTWREYYVFSIVRNPWDLALSLYHWRQNRTDDPTMSLDEFLATRRAMLALRNNFATYAIDDRVAADRVVRYENLTEELDEVRRAIGLPAPLELGRTKSGTRTDRRPYQEVLTTAQAEAIARLSARTIDQFGYTFDAGPTTG